MKFIVGSVAFLALFTGAGLLGNALAGWVSYVDPLWFLAGLFVLLVVGVRVAARRWL